MDVIKTIEDFSLNAWPSFQIQFYDGWILRYSSFYTHRTNSVEQIGVSCLPLPEKVRFCEQAYRKWGTPCIFKISPVGNPDLDAFLDGQAYRMEHVTDVMCTVPGQGLPPAAPTLRIPALQRPPGKPALPPRPPVRLPGDVRMILEEHVSREWLDALFLLKDTTDPVHLRIVPLMYSAIPMNVIAVRCMAGDVPCATGLGILDRDAVGIYAIHVSEARRREGIARAVVSTLLAEGSRRGADFAYLQVTQSNYAARRLYASLGFQWNYRYWFRVKEI